MERNKLLIILLVITLAFCFIYLLSPLLDGILMGVALAYAVRPVHERLSRKIGEEISAFLSTLMISLPFLFFFLYGVFQGVSELMIVLRNIDFYISRINSFINTLDPDVAMTIRPFFTQISQFLSGRIGDIAIGITTKFIFFIMNFLISIIVCFYAIVDGKNVVKKILSVVSPGERTQSFFEEFDRVLKNLWFGNFLFAILLGMASIPYFVLFNIPYAPLLSGLMFLAALIPVFAEWMIVLPVSVYLFFVDWVKGVWFLFVGGLFYYIIPELILRPYFIGQRSKVHPLALMLSFIGGGLSAGVTGFFAGPMLAALLTALYNNYTQKDK